MTDAFDVSLRIKLDYQASAPARAATGDLDAIAAAAKRLGASSTVMAAARDLGELRKGADVARLGLNELAAAGARLNRSGGARSGIGADLGQVARDAVTAGRAVDALGAKLNDAIRAQRASGGFKTGAEFEAFLKGFDAQVKGADRQASALGKVAAGAREAHREVSEVGEAAAAATRDIEKMGAAAGRSRGRAGGTGGGRGGGDDHGDGGQGGHSGPSGWRGAAVAAARPLRMERLVMSAMTPTGLMGLGAGLGVAAVAHQMEDATRRAIELEDAMDSIRRSTGSMSAEGVKSLEGEILRTSRATGQTTAALAKMGAEAAAAGRPAEDLPRYMDFGAKAAGAFGVQVDAVGSQLARVGADFQLDQRGIERAADAAALLQERTGARGGGTLDFMAQTGGAAKLAGLDPERLAAFGATMGRLGMPSGEAASTFGGLLEKLENAPMQGGGFKQGLSHLLGPDGAPESPYALRNTMRADPSNGMLRFLEDVKRLPQQRRAMVLNEMFGPEDGERIGRMADHLDDFRRNLSTVQDTAARSGAVQRVFSVFDEATSKKVDRATAAIGAFATKIGQSFAPAVGAAADATSRLFGGWLDRMDRFDRVNDMAGKLARGGGLSPDEQTKVDADPTLKADVARQADAVRTARAADAERMPDPEAGRQRELQRIGPAAVAVPAGDARERDRLSRVEAIRSLQVYARDHAGVGADDLRDQLAAYASDFPDKPLPAFASGGRVNGPGGPREDRVHALLSAGEFVVNAASAAKHHHLVRAINDDALPAYADGGAVGALAGPSRSDPGADARLEDTIAKGVKAGVVAGLRETRDQSGAAGGSGGASEGDGGGDVEGGGGRPNLRYGRSAGMPNLRYGSAGGRFRGTPASRAHGAYRRTAAGHGGGAGRSAYGSAGGWTIGAGDGSATTENGGPGFTAGMKARNLGNIGYFGQHEAGLVGPSNSRDVDHSIAMYATQEDGVRAAARLAMRKYQGGMRNTAELIAGKHGWTPGALGPGASVNIAKSMGMSNQDDLHLDQPGQMRKFLGALAKQEHGSAGAYYSPEMIDRALKGSGPSAVDAERTVPGNSDRRGFANLMHGQFGAPGQNLTTITTPSGKKATVHSAAADSFKGFLGDLEKSGYDINSLGGYANRGMAGNPNKISQHAYGNAIDINPAQNPFHSSQTNLPHNVSAMAAKWGLSWGGDWSERSRDPMHFEWTGARPWENKSGPEATAANKPRVMPFGLTGSALEGMDRARAARAATLAEDRTTRSSEAERRAALTGRSAGAARPADPGLRSAYDGAGSSSGSGPAARPGAGAAPSVVQHFYGNHDPRETAMHARRESNREIKRAQARALHGVGRPA